jgi:hypothetical protein
MSERDPEHDRRQRRLLVGLAILFFAPIAVSFYLYYGHSTLQPLGRVNRGILIEPPRALPEGAIPSGKWTLLYVGSGECAAICQRKLYETRQVRLALDRDLPRVQRVFVASDPCCDAAFLKAEHPDLLTLRADAERPLLAVLPTSSSTSTSTSTSTSNAPRPDRIYVVDPLGNLFMFYEADAPPKGLLEDMKRLLKLSHIG